MGPAAARLTRSCALVVAVWCGLATTAAAPARAEPSEPELKAEFIERFIRFVDWADGALGAGDFAVCVVGDDPITPYLEHIAKSRKLKNRRTVVRASDKLDRLTACHVVIITGTDKKRLAGALSRTAGHAILTITDAPGAAAAGALINFYRDDSHIKYEINASAAEDSGLVLRAKLLRLARIVGDRDARPR